MIVSVYRSLKCVTITYVLFCSLYNYVGVVLMPVVASPQLLKKWETRERKKMRDYDKERDREEERKSEEVCSYIQPCWLSAFFFSVFYCYAVGAGSFLAIIRWT